MAEKIIARAAGRAIVIPGEDVTVRPDFVLAYELRGYSDVIFRDMAELGVGRLAEPERFAIFIDHRVPAKSPQDEELHIETRRWCAEQGVALFERKGIGHQVAAEMGYAAPGGLVVHFDGHVSQLGAFGTLAFGLRTAILEAFVSGTVSLTVPETVRLELTGRLSQGVMARDVFHGLIAAFGASACIDKVLEISGPGVAELDRAGLQTISGLAMFLGAVTAIVPPDAATLALPHRGNTIAPAYSDPDAVYAAKLSVDLSRLEPMLIAPPDGASAIALSDCLGLPVQAAYLGSCVSGRIEDLRMAARILGGRSIAEGFSLHVVPSSQAIMTQAADEGVLGSLIDAGAFVSSPSCDFCSGMIATMAAGQRAVSTGTLNVPGRMGHVDSEIYLCNAAVLAASAIEGRIADPRPYLQK